MWRKEIFLGRHGEGQVWRIQTKIHLGVFYKTEDHFVISSYHEVHHGVQCDGQLLARSRITHPLGEGMRPLWITDSGSWYKVYMPGRYN